jgi:hypothetical protein
MAGLSLAADVLFTPSCDAGLRNQCPQLPRRLRARSAAVSQGDTPLQPMCFCWKSHIRCTQGRHRRPCRARARSDGCLLTNWCQGGVPHLKPTGGPGPVTDVCYCSAHRHFQPGGRVFETCGLEDPTRQQQSMAACRRRCACCRQRKSKAHSRRPYVLYRQCSYIFVIKPAGPWMLLYRSGSS